MNYDVKKSGERIRQLRIRRGWTQGELAKTLNVDQGFLSRIESGKKGCSVDLLVQMAECFHVSLDLLILGAEGLDDNKSMSRDRLRTRIDELISELEQFQSQL